MATEHFCLRWNNHQSTLVSVFDNLLESGTLVDCTLAADGRYLKAHKVVLSACSPYLGMLLSQHYDKHPIIILKDVKFDELKAMLDYMYRGEVNISQEQLSTFLKAAETLQIKGLTDAGSDEGNGLQPNRPPSSNSTTSANEDPQSPGPPVEGGSSPGPRKRKRNKHGDDEVDSVSKISLSEGSDRLSGTSVGSPSAKSASVKREPADGEGEGQMSVDDSGEVVMMSRPGPSNGGTNNKAPWILSADSSGEEMQLTPGQDTQPERLHLRPQEGMKEVKDPRNALEIIKEEIKKEIKQEEDPFEGVINSCEEESSPDTRNKNPGIVFTIAEHEDELIIPDPLEEPTLLVYDSALDSYQPAAKSSHHPQTAQKDRDESEGSNGDNHNLKDGDYPVVQHILSTAVQCTVERSTTEESLVGVQRHLKNKVLKSSPVTMKNCSENSQTQLSQPSQICLKSSQFSASSFKCLRNVADVSDKNKVKKKTLEFLTSKYRKILPANEDNTCSSKGSHSIQNTQTAMPSNIEKQSTSPSQPHCSPSFSTSAGNTVEKLTCVKQINTFNQQHTQGGLINNPSLTSSMLSVPQQIQVGQIRNTNPSLLSISQQLQGGQIINKTPNVFSIPQNVQSGQINNPNTAVLSITPQFSMPPVQAGNIPMQCSNNTNLQTENLQNTQFLTNTSVSQNCVVNSQNILTQQAISHPIFVTSNIISSCQTSNQFIPSSVQYNFSTAQPTVQSNFSIPTSQPENSASQLNSIPSTSTPTSTSSSGNEQSVYIRTPSGFVHMAIPSEGKQDMKRNQFVRGSGTFSAGFPVRKKRHGRGRGRFPPPHQSMILPKPKPILPKKE